MTVRNERGQGRWGKDAEVAEGIRRSQPARAKVLGLRRFWEGVGKA